MKIEDLKKEIDELAKKYPGAEISCRKEFGYGSPLITVNKKIQIRSMGYDWSKEPSNITIVIA